MIGDGPVDLLYTRGWLSNVEYAWESPDYARFFTKLGRFSRLITFDKRGTCLSDRDVGYPTLEERSEDILTVLDAVGAKQVALLGVSEGGTIAAVFAAMFPERVKSLILYGTYARSKWAPDYPWGTKPEMADRFIAEMRRNWGKPFDLD